MEIHDRWETTAFDLPPLAPHVGPFARRDWLRVWWQHRGAEGELHLVESVDALLPLCWWNGAVRFVGEADLTDYHSPLGADVELLIASYAARLDPGTHIHLDSLPEEAAIVLAAGLASVGLRAEPVQHEIAAVLRLPDTFDEWLASLGGKNRHEVRRKLRRFEAAGGVPRVERWSGDDAVAAFSALHRSSAGRKGSFMTGEMEAFFTALHEHAGGVIDVLEGPGQRPLAAAFAFEDDDTYYLYNTGYDPAARDLSPGIVLIAALIRRAVRSGKQVFDFLKGDEVYKVRHGARPRALYEIRAVSGNSR